MFYFFAFVFQTYVIVRFSACLYSDQYCHSNQREVLLNPKGPLLLSFLFFFMEDSFGCDEGWRLFASSIAGVEAMG